MIAALLLLLTIPLHAGVVRAPVEMPHSFFSMDAGAAVPLLPSYLSVANPADALQLTAILQAAQASPTAVAVLAQVAQAAEVRGRPVVVEVVAMKESGTYNLDWGILSLRHGDMKDGPRAHLPKDLRARLSRAGQRGLKQNLIRVPKRRGLARIQADLRDRPSQI